MTNNAIGRVLCASAAIMLIASGASEAQQSAQAARNVSRPPERDALLIGSGLPQVATAEQRLADVLASAYGFNVSRLDGPAATLGAIVKRIDDFASDARPQDQILVLLALPTVQGDPGTFLIPADANPDQPWTLLRVDDVLFSLAKSFTEGNFVIAPYCRSRAVRTAQQTAPDNGLSLLAGPVTLLTYCADAPAREGALLAALETILRDATTATASVPAGQVAERLSGMLPDIQFDFRLGVAALGRSLTFEPIRDRLTVVIAALQRDPSAASISQIVETTLSFSREQRASGATRAGVALLGVANDTRQLTSLRARAVQGIGEVRATAALPGLRVLVEGADTPPVVRSAVVEAVGRMDGGTAALTLVRGRFRDPDPGVRAAAIRAVLNLRDAASLGNVISLLRNDMSDEVRIAAIQAVLVLAPNSAESRAAAVSALRDKSDAVRGEAATLLGSSTINVSRDLLATLRQEASDEVRAALLYALGRTPHAPSDAADIETTVLAASKAPKGDVRAAAIWSLGAIQSQRSRERVAEALRDSDKEVRASAIHSAGRQANVLAVVGLRSLLESDRGSRVAILDALGAIGERSVIPDVVTYLKDDVESVRDAAGRTLNMLNAATELQDALSDSSPLVRRQAIDALASSRMVPVGVLARALGDPDAAVRESAIRTLSDPRFAAEIDRVLEPGGLDDPVRLQSALMVFGNLANVTPALAPAIAANALEFVDDLMRMRPDPATWAEAVRAAGKWNRAASLPLILEAAGAGDARVRRAVAEALGGYRDPAAQSMLRMLAGDPSTEVQQAAADSLRSLDPARAPASRK